MRTFGGSKILNKSSTTDVRIKPWMKDDTVRTPHVQHKKHAKNDTEDTSDLKDLNVFGFFWDEKHYQ